MAALTLDKAIEQISGQAMEEYEELRQEGLCNMLDLNCVVGACELMGLSELLDITDDTSLYWSLLRNYSGLMEHYGVSSE